MAFEGLSDLALDLRQRHGKPYTSTNAEKYVSEMLNRYKQRSSDPSLLVRGDSGFANPEIYDQCERRGAHYGIKLKNNARLIDQAQHLVQYTNGTDYMKTEHQYFKSFYQANSWIGLV